MSIASLPMYDLPEVSAATDDLWHGIAQVLEREGMADVPRDLSRGLDLDTVWRSPDFLFGQTCGYPYMYGFKGELQLVATPVYDVPGCAGPNYCSFIVVRADDPVEDVAGLRGRTAAITHRTSQSGYSALRAAVARLAQDGRFFGRVVESGAHPNSLAMVAAGEADACATDCVTHALLARHRPAALEGLRILGYSPVAPGLPYVTCAAANGETVARLRAALFAALEDPGLAATREALLIKGAEALSDAAYQRIVDLEQRAESLGYAEVA